MPDGLATGHAEDTMLLAAMRRGDGAAAARIMQRHNGALWRIARGILKNDAEAEEAVQDAWLRAFASASAYRGESALGTWLARIAVNEALRRAQRRRPTVELATVAETLPPDHPGSATLAPPAGPEQAAARSEVRRMVERAVDRLPAAYRVVFMLRVVEQRSVEETAAALNLQTGAVKTRLHRANGLLRAALGGAFAQALEDSFPFGGQRCARLTAAVLARLNGQGPPAPPA